MTLEWWLSPRLRGDRFHVWPNAQVVGAMAEPGATAVSLSNGERLSVDRVIFATGYKAELANVRLPRSGHLGHCAWSTGSPCSTRTSSRPMPGLYFPGFAASRDFGPFFGFTKACPAAATLIVDG